jgi:hypothetical protein
MKPNDAMTSQNGKGKFKCQACRVSFVGKKMYEKHRKSINHKEQEKKLRDEKAETFEKI